MYFCLYLKIYKKTYRFKLCKRASIALENVQKNIRVKFALNGKQH